MARKPQKTEEAARKAAEAAMPGWKASAVKRATRAAVTADYAGSDSAALKAKYLGESLEATAPSPEPGGDSAFVEMTPKGETPVKSRKVIVSGGNVSGFQG